MTLAALCEAAITLSDNTAGNLLLGVMDGPQGLTGYLRGLGDATTRLDRTEPNLNEARPGDPRDTTSPATMLADMQAMTVGTALSEPARTTLQEWLRHNETGDARLRARLPNGWAGGEKIGTSEHGTSNDVGLLWPPNNRRRYWSQPTSPKVHPMVTSAMPPWLTSALPSLRLGRSDKQRGR